MQSYCRISQYLHRTTTLEGNCGEGIGVSEKYVCPTVHSKADVIVSSTLIHDGVVITLGVLFWSLLI